MLNKTHNLLILLVILCGFSTFAQDRPAYDFLRVDPSARASALAGAFDTYTEDPNVIFYNPAGLSTSDQKMLSAAFGKYLLDIKFGAASYAQKYKDIGWFGVGVKFFDYGSFDYADPNGVTNGTFRANDILFTAGYSNFIYDKINYGINLKFIYSSIAEYKSTALAADIGFLYMLHDEQMNFSLSVLNLGAQINPYIDTKENLPLDVRIGISKRLEHLPLRISASLGRINEKQDKFIQRLKAFSIGGEFLFSESFNARIGYSNEKRQDLKLGTSLGVAGFSAGFGIIINDKYKFDYALNSLGKVGSTHKFNLGMTFK
ncbi:MAG: type IX secretion system protein PorQ [Ignavibacteriae bacterium]|nr:MAG: type IX secretion system protein PorQ [Ignavibacteriota bacterium]